MNKIYSLKYSAVTGGLVAVSELARKVTGGTTRKLLAPVIVIITAGLANTAFAASMEISNVWARDYLDLAQNKGIFKPGEKVNLQLKNGSNFTFAGLTIPDFSAASQNGASTSIGGAYSVTATHNNKNASATSKQKYGQTTYSVVGRKSDNNDFQAERLNKFVVETTGVTDGIDHSLSYADALKRYGIDFGNGNRKILGFRVGSGITSFVNGAQKIDTSRSYSPELLSASYFNIINWNSAGKIIYKNDPTFRNYEFNGDSGSGAYVFDNKLKKWVLLGTLHGMATPSGGQTTYISPYKNNIVTQLKNAHTFTLPVNGQNLGSGKLAYNNRDNVLTGGGTLTFYSDVNLGNGGLIFDAGHNYKVITHSNRTFKGAGVDVGKGSTVEWSVKNAAGDTLHKIGEGTLDVKVAQNTNLKTGNGTVVLSTAKTFNNIYMASGHGTVKLNADNALGNGDYSGIFFTENGGTLDLNGHDQTFKYIAATDSGTTITNTNKDKAATLSVNNTDAYIYHGNVTGNTKITHSFDQKQQNGRLILDGDINTSNDISIKNAQLVMQGHATEHAIFREGANSCNGLPSFLCGDFLKQLQSRENYVNNQKKTQYKTNNKVSDFSQPDWEGRT
ncbi:autotransporter outer membrane beta-barrel domain-containing protein, partial [Escherichia coli]|nr:autotransporter outer membrane beta-barrel domain-containing protein [Escherichia coli]